jgi:tRNA dimethylallyltransferase
LATADLHLPENKPLLVILGPTASGKTRLATRVASRIEGEIVSADSRQVYRGMTIGTGKDLAEFFVDEMHIPYHLIDVVEAGDKYNVSQFQKDFAKAYQEICSRGKVPVVCGGSGMYIDAVLNGYAFTDIPRDEALRSRLESLGNDELMRMFDQQVSPFKEIADTSTRKRLVRAVEISSFLSENPGAELISASASHKYSAICFGLNPPVGTRRNRISSRLSDRLSNGLIEEVQELMKGGLSAEQLTYYGLEYKYITLYLTGELALAEMKTKLETEIHRFSKRQMTFFRKMEKDGIVINWLDPEAGEEAMVSQVTQLYGDFLQHNNGTV